MPIHSIGFLPARRTDLIAVRDLDLDALHRDLWSRADSRNMNAVKRPTVNNYVVAMLISQGRMRRWNGTCYVKDPAVWEEEAVDLRELPTPDGRWRCQFCGRDFEIPPRVNTLVSCWECSELIGLRTYFDENLWDEYRNLRSDVLQGSVHDGQ